jgi:hypothetical protein
MSMMLTTRVAAALLLAAGVSIGATQTPAKPTFPITVYKSATCGCCAKWNDHLRASGFTVTNHDLPDVTAVKEQHGVPSALRSCHTALVGGYIVEGHVPSDLIKKMLRERPNVEGIAVPGMPMGSPGMEGSRNDPYDVLTFDRQGRTTVFARR